MFTTSQDLLNLALAVGFGVIAVFLSIALFYLAIVLRDLSQATKAVKHAAEQIDELVIAPTRILSFLFEKVRTLLASVDFDSFFPTAKVADAPKKTGRTLKARGKQAG